MANVNKNNVKRIIQDISVEAANDAYNGQGGSSEIKVVDELPETGKDGDVVVLKTSNEVMSFDLYADENGYILVSDKYLIEDLESYFYDKLNSEIVINPELFVVLTSEEFNENAEVVNSSEELIGKPLDPIDKNFYAVYLGKITTDDMSYITLLETGEVSDTQVYNFTILNKDGLCVKANVENNTLIQFFRDFEFGEDLVITGFTEWSDEETIPCPLVMDANQTINLLTDPRVSDWHTEYGDYNWCVVGSFEEEIIFNYEMYVYDRNEYNPIKNNLGYTLTIYGGKYDENDDTQYIEPFPLTVYRYNLNGEVEVTHISLSDTEQTLTNVLGIQYASTIVDYHEAIYCENLTAVFTSEYVGTKDSETDLVNIQADNKNRILKLTKDCVLLVKFTLIVH